MLSVMTLISFNLNSQPLYPYWDQYNSHFNIYDNGQLKNLEPREPKSFKSGNNICAYVTDVLDFKIYSNGKSKLISKFLPKSYDCSDALVAWTSGVASYVYYDGNIKKLCDACLGFTINDSMLSFTDRYGFFNIFFEQFNH